MSYSKSEVIKILHELSCQDKGCRNENLLTFLGSMDEIIGIHSIRVASYSVLVGKELEFSAETLEHLHTASLLHDIGKLFIDKSILYKKESLNHGDLEAIRQHPSIGQTIVQKTQGYREYANIVLHHHEAYNGHGYPEGLIGTEIPLLSRIIAVSDAYEAMTSERPYRKGYSHREAVNRLKAGIGIQFDPKIIKAFLKALRRYSNTKFANT